MRAVVLAAILTMASACAVQAEQPPGQYQRFPQYPPNQFHGPYSGSRLYRAYPSAPVNQTPPSWSYDPYTGGAGGCPNCGGKN